MEKCGGPVSEIVEVRPVKGVHIRMSTSSTESRTPMKTSIELSEKSCSVFEVSRMRWASWRSTSAN